MDRTPYEAARDLIRSGDLLAFSHRPWRSWYDIKIQLVRMFTRSEWCHVAIAWRVGGRVFVLEAVQPKVRMVPLSLFKNEGFAHIPLKRAIGTEELEFLMGQVGRAKYSQWQAVLAYLGRLKLGADSLTQCCEYAIGARKLSGRDLGSVATPTAVVQEALKYGRMTYVRGE